MADPVLPGSVDREAAVAKASSASPALSPQARESAERQGYQVQFQRNVIKEQERRDAAYVAPDGSRVRNVKEAGVGRPLTGTEVERRLRMLNPFLVFQPSPYPGRVCILRPLSDPVLGETLHYVCAMQCGLMPEFSILNFVEEEYFDAPTLSTPEGTGLIRKRIKIDEKNPETRGWRTVIVRLIKERLITREGAERMFGLPSHDSRNWQGQLQ